MLLFAAAVYMLLSSGLLAERLCDWGFSLRMELITRPFVAQVLPPALCVSVLYGPPLLLFAMVTPFLLPFAARRTGDPAGEAGAIAGRLMTFSTFGSIAGTLLTSYVTLPGLGNRHTLDLLVGIVMAMVAALAWWTTRTMGTAALAVCLLAVCLLAVGMVAPRLIPPRPLPRDAVLWKETAYGRIEVLRRADDSGLEALVFKPSRNYEHSVVYPEHPLHDQLGLSYLTPGVAFGARRFLVLGSVAGGTVRQLEAIDPSFNVTAVELDPAVIDMSQQPFGVKPSAHLRLLAMDARVFLRESRERYDYIVVDLFAGDQLPPHCASTEFFSLVREHLNEGGIVFINSNMLDYRWVDDDATPFRPVRHLQAALRAAGFTSLFQNDLFAQGHLYAFPRPVDATELRARLRKLADDAVRHAELRAEALADAFKSYAVPLPERAARPFTDDWAPEDLLQLKGNIVGLARVAPPPPSAYTDPYTRLRDATQAELVRYLRESHDFGVVAERYCPVLSRFADAQARFPLEALARLWVPAAACPSLDSGAPSVRADVLAYSALRSETVDNRGTTALPGLLALAQRVGL